MLGMDTINAHMLEVRKCLKRWERAFKDEHGRPPASTDIKKDPLILAKYRMYDGLKRKAALETGDSQAHPLKDDAKGKANGMIETCTGTQGPSLSQENKENEPLGAKKDEFKAREWETCGAVLMVASVPTLSEGRKAEPAAEPRESVRPTHGSAGPRHDHSRDHVRTRNKGPMAAEMASNGIGASTENRRSETATVPLTPVLPKDSQLDVPSRRESVDHAAVMGQTLLESKPELKPAKHLANVQAASQISANPAGEAEPVPPIRTSSRLALAPCPNPYGFKIVLEKTGHNRAPSLYRVQGQNPQAPLCGLVTMLRAPSVSASFLASQSLADKDGAELAPESLRASATRDATAKLTAGERPRLEGFSEDVEDGGKGMPSDDVGSSDRDREAEAADVHVSHELVRKQAQSMHPAGHDSMLGSAETDTGVAGVQGTAMGEGSNRCDTEVENSKGLEEPRVQEPRQGSDPLGSSGCIVKRMEETGRGHSIQGGSLKTDPGYAVPSTDRVPRGDSSLDEHCEVGEMPESLTRNVLQGQEPAVSSDIKERTGRGGGSGRDEMEVEDADDGGLLTKEEAVSGALVAAGGKGMQLESCSTGGPRSACPNTVEAANYLPDEVSKDSVSCSKKGSVRSRAPRVPVRSRGPKRPQRMADGHGIGDPKNEGGVSGRLQQRACCEEGEPSADAEKDVAPVGEGSDGVQDAGDARVQGRPQRTRRQSARVASRAVAKAQLEVSSSSGEEGSEYGASETEGSEEGCEEEDKSEDARSSEEGTNSPKARTRKKAPSAGRVSKKARASRGGSGHAGEVELGEAELAEAGKDPPVEGDGLDGAGVSGRKGNRQGSRKRAGTAVAGAAKKKRPMREGQRGADKAQARKIGTVEQPGQGVANEVGRQGSGKGQGSDLAQGLGDIPRPMAEEGTWANPAALRKKKTGGGGGRRGTGAAAKGWGMTGTTNPYKSAPIGRDNFVRLNINGKGGRQRRFINGTKTRKSGSYAGGQKQRYGFKRQRKGGKGRMEDGTEQHVEEADEVEPGNGTRPSKWKGRHGFGQNPYARNGSQASNFWKDEGWLESGPGPNTSSQAQVKARPDVPAPQEDGQRPTDVNAGIPSEGQITLSPGCPASRDPHEKEEIGQPEDGETPADQQVLESCQVAVRERLALAAREDPSEENLREVLRSFFGFEGFREGQVAAIQRVLSQQSTLLILPTGAGKSLCYQLPAAVLPGVTLVISPLVALMVDQLRHLPDCLPGALISSAQSPRESSSVIGRLRTGTLKVLFISPERLFSESFLSVMAELPPVSLAVVDEAHCVSEWSHNFRPSYFRLGRVLLERLRVGAILAMTATATTQTEASITAALRIPGTGVIRSASVRENLQLAVSRCGTEPQRKGQLLALLQSQCFSRIKSIIVYCTFQADTDHVAKYLSDNRIPAKSYHSGKPSDERAKIQQAFCCNRLRVVVATVAFGMGLDKSDVGAVIHYNIPRTLEHYVQEIGRAGRDGRTAQCHLFLVDSDYLKLRSLAHSEGADENAIHRFLMRVFGSQQIRGEEAGPWEGRGCRAIVVESAARDLDLKEEVMSTVLAYLEAEEEPYVQVMSQMNATCDLTFHRKSAEQLAKRSPLVAEILRRAQVKSGHHIFDVPTVARQLSQSLLAIQRELQQLQAQGDVACEFKDPALSFTVLRSPASLTHLTASIAARMADVERSKVSKLDAMFTAATAAAYSTSPPTPPADDAESRGEANGMMPRVPSANEEPTPCQVALQERILTYFDQKDGEAVCATVPSIIKTSSPFLRADIKVFLRGHCHVAFTGRAVARIFHGLWSPAFPFAQWAKNHFWGRHSDVDFQEVKRMATDELVASREARRDLEQKGV